MGKKRNTNKLESIESSIVNRLTQAHGRSIAYCDLIKVCTDRGGSKELFDEALDGLIEKGKAIKAGKGFAWAAAVGAFPAKVTRVNKTFGFIEREDGEEVFIPGKYLLGALPGDEVTARLIPSRTGEPEGEILGITKECDAKFTGMIVKEYSVLFVQPDSLTKNPIALVRGGCTYKEGDKVMAKIVSRGTRHSDHRAEVTAVFGSAEIAAACAMSVLELEGIPTEFPEEVLEEAKRIEAAGLQPDSSRLDLRDEIIFTIDGADTKDIDDAVSIEKTEKGWRLGVHIADVSHYVKPNSPLDREAYSRGTSVYYADRVIPMLPKELSNGICSLNPDEDRFAFSALTELSEDGDLINYEFRKTIIRSRVKGVYSEINKLLSGSTDEEIEKKYSEVKDKLFLMRELAGILTANKLRRGAPQLETTESKLIIGEDGTCVDVIPRTRGESELFIEEFMLTANEAAAKFAAEHELPFVYRIHEKPSPEKVETLLTVLPKLNILPPDFDEIKPCHMAEVLRKAKDSKYFTVVNNLVLRSMAKAKYSEEPVGHFGLALADYSHFTSPIRRYPDLAIHRIMSDCLAGMSKADIKKRYTAFSIGASSHSTEREIAAMNAERSCEDCYKAEYMKGHVGEVFEGQISSVTDFGFYVELPNTVEGLVHIKTLTDGVYEYDGEFTLKGVGRDYSIGDKVRVKCVAADVNSGNVDFTAVEDDK